MKILLQKATITDPAGPLNGKVRDVLIENGEITSIAAKIAAPAGAQVIYIKGLHISPGWVDMWAFIGDPGFEYMEDFSSGLAAAAKGGFTTVAVLPDTNPIRDNKSAVHYLLRQTESHAVRALPIGALTAGLKGKDIAEIYDMHQAGAVAFANGQQYHLLPGAMLRALQYVKPFDGLVYRFPHDPTLAEEGLIHEGKMSAWLGLKGIPDMAESTVVELDVQLVEYTGSRLHFAWITTPRSLEILKKAKQAGHRITAMVPASHLLLDDSLLEDFDSCYKSIPPLRTKDHIKAIKKALLDGTIDAIGSGHDPKDTESKIREFDDADFGMAGLETAFAAARTALGKQATPELLVEKLAINPRKILDLPTASVAEGANADLTLFLPDKPWTPQQGDYAGKGVNYPLTGKNLIGKPLGIINKGQVVLHSQQ